MDNAFGQWLAIDPATGLGTDLSFLADFATPVDAGGLGSALLGAEIDLFGLTTANSWGPGDPDFQGEVSFGWDFVGYDITLTSGTTQYLGAAISGMDIRMNNNPQALWDLVSFETVLAHEIGHTLGLEDVGRISGPSGQFIDDN